jgi:UDP-N-acetyl-D-glucosamine dehydrogenase
MYNINLKNKLLANTATIGVVGLGYVGLPLSIAFCSQNMKVIGFDSNGDKVKSLNSGKSYIHHINSSDILSMTSKKLFFCTSDWSNIAKCDAIIICLPSPLGKNQEPDISIIREALAKISNYIRPDQLISLESTTYPGTTEEEILPLLQDKNLKCGENFHIVYSPEREDPANKDFSTQSIPKIVSGITDGCLEAAIDLYSKVINSVIPVSSCKVAELSKLLENIHRAVNIGLANEMKVVADKMDIDIFEVIDAAATKPFGFVPYYPGPGLGGHCIPIDPFYLSWKAKEFGVNAQFIELSGEVNRSMPDFVVSKVFSELNKIDKTISNSKILAIGVSYKKDVDDYRESPALNIIEKLSNLNANISFHDPFVKSVEIGGANFNSIDLTQESIKESDLILILTDHSLIDYDLISDYANLILDSRGVYRKLKNHIKRT